MRADKILRSSSGSGVKFTLNSRVRFKHGLYLLVADAELAAAMASTRLPAPELAAVVTCGQASS